MSVSLPASASERNKAFNEVAGQNHGGYSRSSITFVIRPTCGNNFSMDKEIGG
jgi:hypothetical protein